jgi:hypothetical protein
MALTRKRPNNEVAELSEYELKRRDKMMQNAAFLQSVGMARAQLDMKRGVSKTERVKPKKATTAPKAVRRSSRLKAAPILNAAAERYIQREEKRKQEIVAIAANKRRFRAARRKREVAEATAEVERERRAEHRAELVA